MRRASECRSLRTKRDKEIERIWQNRRTSKRVQFDVGISFYTLTSGRRPMTNARQNGMDQSKYPSNFRLDFRDAETGHQRNM